LSFDRESDNQRFFTALYLYRCHIPEQQPHTFEGNL
jgi:hypothetical protein